MKIRSSQVEIHLGCNHIEFHGVTQKMNFGLSFSGILYSSKYVPIIVMLLAKMPFILKKESFFFYLSN